MGPNGATTTKNYDSISPRHPADQVALELLRITERNNPPSKNIQRPQTNWSTRKNHSKEANPYHQRTTQINRNTKNAKNPAKQNV